MVANLGDYPREQPGRLATPAEETFPRVVLRMNYPLTAAVSTSAGGVICAKQSEMIALQLAEARK